MSGKKFAGNCIDRLPNQVLVSADEKERILTKIGAFAPKPKLSKRITMIMLIISMVITLLAAMNNIGKMVGLLCISIFLIAMVWLILLYFLGGLWPYYDWKKCVKEIRNREVYKVKVVPRNVWKGEGCYKNYYMEISGENGEELGGSYMISKELADNWKDTTVWAYFHKSAGRYQKLDIYLVGEGV